MMLTIILIIYAFIAGAYYEAMKDSTDEWSDRVLSVIVVVFWLPCLLMIYIERLHETIYKKVNKQ